MNVEAQAVALLRRASEAAKCGPCGCARSVALTVSSNEELSADARAAAEVLRGALVEERYDCLGCRVCWPAEALGILGDAGLLPEPATACPTEPVAERAGWPSLPGDYTVLRWGAPVAVCTLGDADLAHALATEAPEGCGIVGTVATENLGIERLVRNTVANPHLRFVVLAGPETRHAVGHLPGASLVALAAHGTDDAGRIIDAPGRRPVLRNITTEEITRFREVVEVVDLIGETDIERIGAAVVECLERDLGPAPPRPGSMTISPIAGHLPARMTPDPAGYFVVYPDPARQLLNLEHYTNEGILDAVVEGATPAECYTAVIDTRMISRLDHAAYLGRELARAEAALTTGSYVQDAAPEQSRCTQRCSRSAAPAHTEGLTALKAATARASQPPATPRAKSVHHRGRHS